MRQHVRSPVSQPPARWPPAFSVRRPSRHRPQPIITGGLVDVTVTDVIDDVTVVVQDINVSVGAALGIAANVCDVNVNVLAQQLRNGGAQCVSDASGQTVTIDQI